jgi:hypothetical protein
VINIVVAEWLIRRRPLEQGHARGKVTLTVP